MRVLIDTNIIIHREANRVVNEDIGILFNWLDKLQFEKCIHPVSKKEISQHRDEKLVKTMRIKMANYNELKTFSKDDEAVLAIRKIDKSQNDFFDTDIVKEVYNGRVDYLITEDRGIHRKATILGISEKVFNIETFLEKCIAENPDLKDYQVLAVKKEYFGNINLEDEFFDSFKEDYAEFKDWFNRKSDNISYVCTVDNKIKAFLYLKVEEPSEPYRDINPAFPEKKRLKIGTFKVTSTGLKLGERFLKIIFDNAVRYEVDEIYVTIFGNSEEQLRLIYILEDWGFRHWGEKLTQNGTEQVFIRECIPVPNLVRPKLSFPAISRNTQKWIVPIYPAYHTELFPDSILNNESPEDFSENEPHRNAIKKVYISRAFNRNLSGGDLVLFYRTGGHYAGVVSTIGVVENVITNIRDENHFIELCRKRSVFTDKKLKEHWNYNKYNRPFIVNFLYIDSFPMPKVNLKKLRELNIMQNAPRGFEPLTEEQFQQILTQARANESYLVN